MTRWRLARAAEVAFVLVASGLIYATHSRWIMTHFSSDAYLEDSGWLAHLFESADPLLRNPSGVNGLSFYAHHLSPHFFLFGAPLSTLLGLDGFGIFALHQGLFFALFFVALYIIGAHARMGRDRIVATLSAVLLGASSNALLQAAAYPHYEIAMIALASLAIAGRVANCPLLFVICLIWLPLVREDGGFYAAVACLACVAVEQEQRHRVAPYPRLLLLSAGAGLLASALSFLIKARFFPGFDAFANNFSGQAWSHVTPAFLAERAQALLFNLNILPVLLGCALLSRFDIRYVTGLLLLSPVYLVHLLAVRPEHGFFTLYFALPWLLPPAMWLAVLVQRSRMSRAGSAEGVVLLAASLALSAPLHAAAGVPGQFLYVARWAFERPVVNLRDMKEYVVWARQRLPAARDTNQRSGCVSQGIAALVPNHIEPEEVLTMDADLRGCHALILMRGDMHYGQLSARALEAGFVPMNARYNAEVWLSPGAR
jgi:hypothetical protein